MLRSFVRDFRTASRVLLRRPAFAVSVILTFAVGIGINTALFSVVHGVLLRPLPYPDPDRLVIVWQADQSNQSYREGASVPDFLDWRSQQKVFSGLEAYHLWEGSLIDPEHTPERVLAGEVTEGFFPLFGVRPALGRTFLPEESRPGGERVVLLSHAFWQRRFSGSPDVLGKTVRLDEVPHEVVGVLPPNFVSPTGRDEVCWMPMRLVPDPEQRSVHELRVFGRLRPGVSLAQAQAEMAAIMLRLERAYPHSNRGRTARVVQLYEDIVGDVRTSLLALFGIVSAVLLIACVNVTSLLLARTLERRREVALHAALGSSRLRVMGKLMAEALFLAAVGGVLGVVLASLIVRLLVAAGPQNVPRLDGVSINGTVLAFGLLVALVAGVVCSLVPAFHASRLDLQAALKDGSASSTAGIGRKGLRRLLVVVEVALAAVLVISAGLLVKSFYRLLQVELGFQPRNVVTMGVTLPQSRYPSPERANYPRWPELEVFYQRLVERVGAVPGVQRVSVAGDHPLAPGWTTSFTLGDEEPQPGEAQEVRLRTASPTFFQATGTAVLQGRNFTPSDDADAPPVLIVNQAFVRRYYGNTHPIGQRVSFWGRSREVIGVVQDVRFMGLGEEVPPAVYAPFLQVPLNFFNIVVQTRKAPQSLIPALQEAIWSVEPNVAIYNVYPMEELLAETVAQPRFNMQLVGLFGLVAAFLAAIGIYGLMSNSIAQRTAEIGIRMALGSQKGEIARLLLGEGMRLLVIGLVLGLGLALATTRLLQSLLFQVSSADPAIFAGVLLLLIAVGLLASLVPVLRATRVSPMVALRYE